MNLVATGGIRFSQTLLILVHFDMFLELRITYNNFWCSTYIEKGLLQFLFSVYHFLLILQKSEFEFDEMSNL